MRFKKWTRKSLELLLLLIYFAVATIFILLIQANHLTTILIYFGIPSVYLSITKPEIIKKTLLFSLVFAIPGTLLVDYSAHVNNAWFVPSISGLRILDSFPIDEFIWGITYSYFIVSFYEYFFDQDKNKRLFSHNTKKFFYTVSALLTAFGVVYLINKDLFIINYYYIILICIAFLLPIALVLYKYPALIIKMVLVGSYFFLISLTYEVVATYLEHWHFYGTQYIGFVELFGQKFPFEEFMWLIFAVPAIPCIYEYFVDDTK